MKSLVLTHLRRRGFWLLLLLGCTLGRLAAEPMTIASLKIIPEPGNKAGNFAKFERYARQAAGDGAKIIVTSECFLDGYLGHKKMHPEMTLEKLAAMAEPIDGPYVQKAAALARELSVHLLFGFSERRGPRVYNTAALIAPTGKLLGTYSKSHTGDELYEPGSEFPVFATPVGRIGMLICFDRQLPETSRTLALKGAEIILIPAHSPNVGVINEDLMMRVRAYENNVFVVLANPYNTVIVDSSGEIIAHNAVREAEGIVAVKIDLAQRDSDRGAFQNRRPELYRELVQPRPPAN